MTPECSKNQLRKVGRRSYSVSKGLEKMLLSEYHAMVGDYYVTYAFRCLADGRKEWQTGYHHT